MKIKVKHVVVSIVCILIILAIIALGIVALVHPEKSIRDITGITALVSLLIPCCLIICAVLAPSGPTIYSNDSSSSSS